LQEKLENKTVVLCTLENDNKNLTQQLVDAKQFMNDIKDQNKLLTHEKWELAQEKSQLQGQMKQLQKMIHTERV
jgi:predicted nuclease with TOPRIM domain